MVHEFRTELRNRVLGLPFLVLLLIPVNCHGFVFGKVRREWRHGNDVPVGTETVELRLHQAWPFPCSSAFRCVSYHFAKCNGVSAVDSHTRNAERFRFL